MKTEESVFELKNFDTEKASKEEMVELIEHLKSQFSERYQYLLGEWSGAYRAKNTQTGQFVSKKEINEYLT